MEAIRLVHPPTMAKDLDDQDVGEDRNAHQRHQKTQQHDKSNGFDAEGGDPIERQRQHLLQRIFALPSKTLMPLVSNGGGRVTDQADDTPRRD